MRVHALILIACAATGCAGAQVKTDADKDADFSRYRSYTLQRGRVLSDQSAPDVSANPLLEERIQKAIARELARKGLQPTDPSRADLIATYTASAQTRKELETVAPAVPGFEPYDEWYWGPGYEDVWIDEYQEGTLVIDLIDADTRKLVWRAIARAKSEQFSDEGFIRGTVDKAIDKYPAPAARSAKQ
jgi:hypothetical protein